MSYRSVRWIKPRVLITGSRDSAEPGDRSIIIARRLSFGVIIVIIIMHISTISVSSRVIIIVRPSVRLGPRREISIHISIAELPFVSVCVCKKTDGRDRIHTHTPVQLPSLVITIITYVEKIVFPSSHHRRHLSRDSHTHAFWRPSDCHVDPKYTVSAYKSTS